MTTIQQFVLREEHYGFFIKIAENRGDVQACKCFDK